MTLSRLSRKGTKPATKDQRNNVTVSDVRCYGPRPSAWLWITREGEKVTGRDQPDNPWARRNLLVERSPGAEPANASVGAAPQPDTDGYSSPANEMPAERTFPAPEQPDGGAGEPPARPAGDDVRVAWYAADRQRVDPLPEQRRLPVWSGPVRPHLGGGDVDTVASATWWWLGVHGGAGVTTLATFVSGGAHAHRRWPDPGFGGPRIVVLVCRTHLTGLERARDAARQWASSDVPAGLLLGGAVAVADAPGRLTRPQSEALRLLSGAVPRLWTVPWVEELRAADDLARLPAPPALARLGADLDRLRGRAARGRR